MKIIYADEFRKKFKKLPKRIQHLFFIQEKIFVKNWRDSRLHIKKLTDHPYPFSFRITRNYRVLFVFTSEDMVLLATIGHRKDSYR